MIDALEPRRLLTTYTINATPGDDTIIVNAITDLGVAYYDVTINGTTQRYGPGSPLGDTVNINADFGNDVISVRDTNFSNFITVDGGPGNDTVNAGSGNLGKDIDGGISVYEYPGEGNDTVIINDSSDSTGSHDPVHITTDQFGVNIVSADETLNFDGRVEFFGVENPILNLSSQADQLYVDAPVAGMQVNLGNGANTVYYGGNSHVLFGTVYPMTITAGVNFDQVIFDDSGGGDGTVGRDYDITPTAIMGQTLSGVEHAELHTRTASSFSGNSLSMSGKPAGMSTIHLTGGWTDASIGSSVAPLDLDSTDVTLTNEMLGITKLYDQDNDATVDPFYLWTVGSPKELDLIKGNFRLNLPPAGYTGLSIFGGSTNDVFNVAGVGSYDVEINGGGGDDILEPFNFGGNNSQGDLDAIFTTQLQFNGGPGIDTMDLYDNLDAVGDGDAAYLISDQEISKGPALGNYPTKLISYSRVDQINFAADGDNNSITFGGGADLSLDGGAGNDFFNNYTSGSSGLNVYGGTTTISGGAGNDSLNIVDRVNQAVTEYDFDPSSFWYRVAGSPGTPLITYDGALESFTLDENDAGTLTNVNAKPAALRLTVNAWAGDDTVQIGGGDLDSSGLSSATTTLGGGAGNDLIVFDDHLDEHNTVNADTFTFTQQTAIKDSTVFVYAGFESQKLITSGMFNPAIGTAYWVRISGIDIPTEIEGGAGSRNNTVDIGDSGQGPSHIFAPVTLNFLSATVDAAVYDTANTTGHVFNFSATQMSSPAVVNYSGVENLYVYAGSGADTLNATSSAAGMTVFFNGGAGNDTMNVGSSAGSFADLPGRIFAAGGDGTDTVFFTNGTVGGFTDGVLTNGGFKANGGPTHLYQAEAVQVVLNDQGSNIDVTSLTASTGIQGGAGDDMVTIGGGDLDVSILASIFVQGAGGFDRIFIDDHNGTNQPGTPATYTADVFNGTGGPVDRFYGVNTVGVFFIACLNVEQRQFDASNDANVINVVDSVHDLRINSNGGNDTITVTDATGVVTVDTGAGEDLLTINSDSGTAGDGPVTVAVDHTDDLNYLDLRPGGTLRVSTGAVLLKTAGVNSGLSLAGVLDLAGGAMLFRAAANVPSQATFRSKLITGRNGGAWNGAAAGAINSSLAATSPTGDGVGYGLGSDLGLTTVGPFAINPADTLVRYTLNGDANLDHRVDLTDFTILAANFNGTGKVWSRGDFNYDGAVDLTDFTMLAANFNGTLPSDAALSGAAPSAAPVTAAEPAPAAASTVVPGATAAQSEPFAPSATELRELIDGSGDAAGASLD